MADLIRGTRFIKEKFHKAHENRDQKEMLRKEILSLKNQLVDQLDW